MPFALHGSDSIFPSPALSSSSVDSRERAAARVQHWGAATLTVPPRATAGATSSAEPEGPSQDNPA